MGRGKADDSSEALPRAGHCPSGPQCSCSWARPARPGAATPDPPLPVSFLLPAAPSPPARQAVPPPEATSQHLLTVGPMSDGGSPPPPRPLPAPRPGFAGTLAFPCPARGGHAAVTLGPPPSPQWPSVGTGRQAATGSGASAPAQHCGPSPQIPPRRPDSTTTPAWLTDEGERGISETPRPRGEGLPPQLGTSRRV